MLTYPQIDPVIVQLGPVAIHWYGFMYLCAFATAWWLGVRRSRQADSPYNAEQVGDLIFYGALGAVLGGRIGYVLFYDFEKFIEAPWKIIMVWEGGMSFHGGLLGVLLAMYFFSRYHKHHFFTTTDFIAPLVPLGLGFGRMGNFINGELWGAPSNLPWAMVFPHVDQLARHPSQLYEALLEGLVLFIILWWFSSKPRPMMAVSGVFLLGYAVFRFAVEFVRLPDKHLGYLAFDWLTMGHLLTLPMFFFGALLLFLAYRPKNA